MSDAITNPLPADTDALLAELKRHAERSKRLSRLQLRSGLLFLCHQTFNILMHHTRGVLQHIIEMLWLLLGIYLVCVVFCSWYDQKRNKRRRHALIRELESDIRAVGPLLLFLHDKQDRYIKDLVYEVLTTLLPRLKSSDTRLLTAEQQNALVGLLKISDELNVNRQLKLAAIRALQQVGDERAIAPMRALLHGGSSDPEVKAAARECLPFLETNAANRGQSHTLLRASDSASATPEILLRPAAPTQTSEGREVLLRSVE